MQESGTGYAARDVHAYLEAKAAGRWRRESGTGYAARDVHAYLEAKAAGRWRRKPRPMRWQK